MVPQYSCLRFETSAMTPVFACRPVVGRQPFRLLAEEAALEFLVRFEQAVLECPVALPIGLRVREGRFQRRETSGHGLARRRRCRRFLHHGARR